MIGVVLINLLPGGVLAVDQSWSFASSGDYSVSDATLAEISGSTARLKVRNYASDSNTSALYHLDESSGTSATDSSSNANTGTVTGGTFGTGNLNNGLALNGTTGQISAADSASLSLSQANTIEAWTKFDSAFSATSHSQRQMIVDKGEYQLYYDRETGKVKYELADSTNEWNQVAGRSAGSNINGGPDPSGAQFVRMVNSGSTIYAGLSGVGTVNENNSQIWRWNGSAWTQIGGDGLNSSWNSGGDTIENITAMVMMGTDLYVGTAITAGDGEVWKWNGSTWSKIGGDAVNSSWAVSTIEWVRSLETDGTNIYAGTGSTAGDGDVWKWNGSTWSQIGGDALNSGWAGSAIESVYSLDYFGGTLYAGTGLTAGDGDVWSWNGSAWTQIGGDGLNSGWAGSAIESVWALENDGTNLYAGMGETAGDGDVWKWNGSAWTQIGGDGLNSGWAASTYETVESLHWDGTTLYASTGISTTDGEIWSWNGSAWTKIEGDAINSGETPEEILNILSISGTLYAATADTVDGAQVWSWNGSAWSQIGGEYLNSSWGYFQLSYVSSMTTGNGYLYAGTGATAGDAMVWQWDGSTWTMIAGQGQNSSWSRNAYDLVSSMTTYKGNLYVGLAISANEAEVWKWNGSTWSQVGGDSLNSGWATGYESVRSLTVHNGLLYAGIGDSAATDDEVWSWNDSSWTKVGGDSVNSSWTNTGGVPDYVENLISWGGDLYAGLSGAGSGDAEIWKFNGATWSQIGGDGVNSSWPDATFENVASLTVYDGALYAGLGLTTGDADIWKWNGATWAQIGGDGLNSSWSDTFETVTSMAVYNGDLYAGVGIGIGDGELWKWNGSVWSKVAGDSINGGWQGTQIDNVHALTVYSGKLYAGIGDTVGTDFAIWAYGNNAVLSSAATTQDTSWHHIAATYDGVTMKLYIDGSLNASQAIATSMPDTSHTLLIGSNHGSYGTGQAVGYFQGSIDEVRISNTARSSFTTTPYASSAQTVQPTAAVLTSGVKSWDGFSASETANGGTITYRLSSDGGTTWKFYTGGAWTTSSSISQASTVSTVNTNIPTFTVGTGGFLWQAVLTGDGTQRVTLSSVTITYTEDAVAPTNPTATSGLDSSGGSTSLTSGNWYNYSAPYFSWTGAVDTGGSGVQGYFVYFGTDNTAEPTTAGAFQTTANYTASGLSSGSTYYLRIKTRDVAQNVSASAYDAFTYKYDATNPNNPSGVSVNPSGYTSTNSFTFLWPSTGGGAASDANSGVVGYQYKTGASSGALSSYSATITETQITIADAAYQEGPNTFYLRTIDNAGNTSNPITATFYYNQSAPTAPQNLTATPTSNTSNSFAFSWDVPASYSGNASELTYYYSVNAVPTAQNVTSNGSNTSLSAGPYATQQGTNTFYVVAKDAANNINYSAYASTTFTATTIAPGQPLNLTIADSSNRESGTYRLSLTWDAPSSGTVSSYKVHRATDGSTFSLIGTTSSTGYIDSDLSSSITYSYKVYAVDSAGATSVASATVSKQPTGKYTTPPTITINPTATAGATSVTITWTTDRDSDAFVEYGTTTNYDLSFGQREDVTNHSVKIIGLTSGTIYHYRVQSLDSGDLRDYPSDAGKSDDFTFETTAAPGLSNVAFSDITTNSTILTFETSKAATSTIDYGTSTNYGSTLSDESSGSTTKHTLRLKDLTDGTTYQLRITIEDGDGNTVVSPGHAFTTVAKPRISNVRFETLPNEAQTTVKVTWTTNVDTTGSVSYTSDGAEKKEVATSEYKPTHEFVIRGLKDQSTYRFQAISRDKFGNEAASDTNSVATPVDTRAPQVKNLTVEIRSSGVSEAQKAQLVVSWETDEPATSAIEYGPGISSENYPAKSQEDPTLTTNHVVIVSELEPSKLYHLRAISKDGASNEGKSSDTTAITGKIQRSVIDIILNSLQRSFGFLSRLRGSR